MRFERVKKGYLKYVKWSTVFIVCVTIVLDVEASLIWFYAPHFSMVLLGHTITRNTMRLLAIGDAVSTIAALLYGAAEYKILKAAWKVKT